MRISPIIWIGWFILIMIPYLMATLSIFFPDSSHPPSWRTITQAAFRFSLVLSSIIIAMVCGCAFSLERADRSAEFLAYMPPSRKRIVTSKAIVNVFAILAIQILNPLVLFAVSGGLNWSWKDTGEFFCLWLPSTFYIFSFSWFFSSFLKSPIISTGLGIASFFTFGIFLNFFYYFPVVAPMELYTPIAIVLSIAAFIGGIVCYLYRTEP